MRQQNTRRRRPCNKSRLRSWKLLQRYMACWVAANPALVTLCPHQDLEKQATASQAASESAAAAAETAKARWNAERKDLQEQLEEARQASLELRKQVAGMEKVGDQPPRSTVGPHGNVVSAVHVAPDDC